MVVVSFPRLVLYSSISFHPIQVRQCQQCYCSLHSKTFTITLQKFLKKWRLIFPSLFKSPLKPHPTFKPFRFPSQTLISSPPFFFTTPTSLILANTFFADCDFFSSMAELLPQSVGSDPPEPAPADSPPSEMDQFSMVSLSDSGTEAEEASPIRSEQGPGGQNPTGSNHSIFRLPSSDSPVDNNCLTNWLRSSGEEVGGCSRLSQSNDRRGSFRSPFGSWRPFEPIANPFSWQTLVAPRKVEIEPTGLGSGLSNLGNTCFLNAVLQCFTHTVPLVQGLQSVNQDKACTCGGEDFCVLCALKDHIKLALNSSGAVISPFKIFDNLNHISPDFQRYHQEDAHEFLVCLLDKIESCLDSNLKNTGQSSAEENLIKQIFGGRLVSKLSCCNCGHCSETHEPMNHLSLEIEDVDTLPTALESFTRVEQLNSEAKFKCENCKEEVCVQKQLLLDQVPSIMAFHLKRFKNDGWSVEKIDKHVEFPLELDMQPYTISNKSEDVELKYQLYAVVEHYGFSPSSGHYISYVHSSPDTWHMLNDSRVTKAEQESVLSEGAYILFYAKQDIPWFSSAIKVQKPCMNDDAFNTSPKSVLDNMDSESASRAETADDCLNGGSENDADSEAMITSKATNDDERNRTSTADGSSASFDLESRLSVSELSDSTVKVPVLGPSVLPDSNVCSDDRNQGNRLTRDAEVVRKSSSALKKSDKSHVPLVAQERSSGPCQEASFIHSKNLKARRSAHAMSGNTRTIDRGRRDAVRYCSTNMPSARGSRFIQSIMGSQTPPKGKRMGSSPVKGVGLGKRKFPSPYKRASPHKRKFNGRC